MRRAFTLIELLIVVAIIAILAAIAVPNFLEAQTRSKVSRAKNDMRALATGLEAYRTDNNGYPGCHTFGIPGLLPTQQAVPPATYILERLSTPITYITTAIFPNPFNAKQRISSPFAAQFANTAPGPNEDLPVYRSYLYQSGSDTDRIEAMDGSAAALPPESANANKWILHSPGPQEIYFNMGGVLANSSGDGLSMNMYEDCMSLVYDPTNGTTSFGAIWRVGGNSNSHWAKQMFRAAELSMK